VFAGGFLFDCDLLDLLDLLKRVEAGNLKDIW
jgi:hypothetical protein